MVNTFQPFWASIPVYNLVLMSTKLSIILQYMRVFSVGKYIRLACRIMLVVVVCYGLGTILGAIFRYVVFKHASAWPEVSKILTP